MTQIHVVRIEMEPQRCLHSDPAISLESKC